MSVVDNRQLKTVEVRTYELDGIKLVDLAKWAASSLENIPEKARHTAFIDINSPYDGSVEVNVLYSRLETWDEMEKREAEAKRWNDRRIADAKKILGIE